MSVQVVITLDQADATKIGKVLRAFANATTFELESISIEMEPATRDAYGRVADALLEPRETRKLCRNDAALKVGEECGVCGHIREDLP